MIPVNLVTFTKPVIHQRRFRWLLAGLIAMSVMLGLIVVPIENQAHNPRIHTYFDGIWWAVITVTGVGYGDIVPVTVWGRIIGMFLAIIGVTSYGLIISMFSLALEETRDRYYRLKMFESLDNIQKQLDRIEKNATYIVQNNLKSHD